jgi:acyl-CoA synthetase (AMP-forming)/AMP-acid ligase II
LPDDVALFQYTGGTTGEPKAAMLTHRNLVANALQARAWLPDHKPGLERMMCAIPFFHAYGMTVGMNLSIALAAEMIIVPNPRPIDNVMGVLARERATLFRGVPAMYIGIINHPGATKYDLTSVRACISGAAPLPMVMQGYWNRPEDTAEQIDTDGWLHTGDIATIDADGYFAIVDRKKDIIIASGYKVLPREVEEVLFAHPAVLEAAVAGVPNPYCGETVKAYVVLKPGACASAEEITAYCRVSLAPYKVPTEVEFRNELPKTMIGKVLRRVLVAEERQKQGAVGAMRLELR